MGKKYKRLTHQKYDENIDLTKEFGYSYIYKRLYELENKLESGTLIELPMIETGDKELLLEFLNKEIYDFCKDCSAWSGRDCTRNPYTDGCLKDNKAGE